MGKSLFLDNIIYSIQVTGGISVYWTELCKRLIHEHNILPSLELIRYTNEENNIFFSSLKELDEFTYTRKEILSYQLCKFFPLHIDNSCSGLLHSSYLRVTNNKKIKNIVTIHDLLYEKKYISGIGRIFHLRQKKMAINRSDVIICISNNTKNDLLNIYPEARKKKIYTIYNGVSDYFYPIGNDSNYNDLELPNKYVLFVGDRSTYKRFSEVVKSLKYLTEYHLVIAGGKKINENELSFLSSTIPNRFHVFTSVSSVTLNKLYNNAHCLVYPSSYEGFGIPIVEAMRAGCPVIAVNNSSIPEISNESAFLLDVLTVEDLAQSIRYLENDIIRERFIKDGIRNAARFSWDNCYQETKQLYIENI